MAYNPNPPYNPSDYGIKGRIDYAALEKSLQDARDQIASFTSSEGSKNSNAKKALRRIAKQEQPVYGEGVITPERITKNHKKYGQYKEGPPQFYLDRQADFKESQDNFETAMAAMNNRPEEEVKEVKNKKPKKDKEKTVEEVIEGLKLPDYNKTEKTTTTTAGKYQRKPAGWGNSGMDFDQFLQKAQGVRADVDPDDDEGGTQYFSSIQDLYPEQRLKNEYTYTNTAEADIYNQLSRAGLSNQDMQDAAQSIRLREVNTQKDINNVIKAFQGGNITPKDITTTTNKNVGMADAKSAFGNLFTKKNYNAALNYENQDKKYIKNYLKGYIEEGGNVSDKVKKLLKTKDGKFIPKDMFGF